MKIDFAKLDGEQFCRLHSGHLRRSVPNGSNLHDARNCVSVIRPFKEEDSFAESCRSVVEFRVEDSHPFPLIVSELASGHQKNVYPCPPA
ncbi:putative inactive ribonuclease [Trichinella spiralis]|uniref:Inactive ribonuclease n=1 Tax=Trichinella spiralis TaxID=6334 RepID=A0ABR3K3P5_TRISP